MGRASPLCLFPSAFFLLHSSLCVRPRPRPQSGYHPMAPGGPVAHSLKGGDRAVAHSQRTTRITNPSARAHEPGGSERVPRRSNRQELLNLNHPSIERREDLPPADPVGAPLVHRLPRDPVASRSPRRSPSGTAHAPATSPRRREYASSHRAPDTCSGHDPPRSAGQRLSARPGSPAGRGPRAPAGPVSVPCRAY